MLVVALTGGIGSGKTTVSQLFAAFGTPVIDADIIARQLVAPGEPALDEITNQFGRTILTNDESLDRTKLRQIIFQDAAKKAQLESILHPLIRKEIAHQIAAQSTPYCIIAIPLLVESGRIDIADRVLVVDTPEAMQLARVMRRDNQTENEITSIIASQAPRDTRLAIADDVIHNHSNLKALKEQVEMLHQQYLAIANAS